MIFLRPFEARPTARRSSRISATLLYWRLWSSWSFGHHAHISHAISTSGCRNSRDTSIATGERIEARTEYSRNRGRRPHSDCAFRLC